MTPYAGKSLSQWHGDDGTALLQYMLQVNHIATELCPCPHSLRREANEPLLLRASARKRA